MGFEFSMATQYSRDLAKNTMRGLHEKVKRGEYPSVAPVGYLNDTARKIVVKDKREAPVVIKTFELCAEGNSRLEDLSMFLFKGGIKTRATNRWRSEGGRPLSRDQVSFMLSNPFYIGLFRYAGELYEGKHPPLISKQLFDKVQAVLKGAGGRTTSRRTTRALLRPVPLRRVRMRHHRRGEDKASEERQRP